MYKNRFLAWDFLRYIGQFFVSFELYVGSTGHNLASLPSEWMVLIMSGVASDRSGTGLVLY